MTVGELIRELQKFPSDTLVLKYRPGVGRYDGYWETMDGHWFKMVTVVYANNPFDAGRYYEPKRDDQKTVDALEL